MANKDLTPMQQELFDRADAIFGAIARGAEKVGTFAAEQIPDIAYQYVAFGRAYLTAIVVATFLIWLTAVYFATRFVGSVPAGERNYHDGCIFTILGSIAGTGAAFTIILVNLKEFMMVWFAPKVWLILEMKALIR